MKKLIFLLSFIFIGLLTKAQFISYSYDDNGNRILRKVITLKSSQLTDSEDEESITDSWDEKQVKIFPNPTNGILKITISGGNPDAEYSYKVFNSKGAIVFNRQRIQKHEFLISFEDYNTGIYILVLQCNNMSKTYKIVKQ